MIQSDHKKQAGQTLTGLFYGWLGKKFLAVENALIN